MVINFCIFFIIISYTSIQGQQDISSKLIGTWKSDSEFGSFVLEFRSSNELTFAGESAYYTLLPGVIRVQDEYDTVDYRYALQDNKLVIAFPEGYQLTFTKVGGSPLEQPNWQRNQTVEKQSASKTTSLNPQANTVSSSQVSSDEVGDPNWGFKFNPPRGWKFQKGPQGAVLGHDTIAGMILVIPHMTANLQLVQQEMQEGLVEEGTQLHLAGKLVTMDRSSFAGEYQGIYQGQQVKARGIGTLSPFGGGAYIIALTIPSKYGLELSGAAETIARNMKYFQVNVSGLVSHFSGTWVHTTGSTTTWVTMAPTGEFSTNYEAGYWGQLNDQLGNQTGNWDVNSSEKSQGRWTVRGNREQGNIIITYPNGSETYVQYRVHVEKGQTYWNEYKFDGNHYSKRR
jgi:hypothetical protein